MAMDEMVKKVNSELRTLLEEAEAHRDSPRFVRAIKAIVRLTNSPSENAKMDQADAEAADPKKAAERDIKNQIAALQAQLPPSEDQD
jgi:hypothetical protein